MRWACGVTTVPRRLSKELPRTLASLAAAGFDAPRLFVDGASDPSPWRRFSVGRPVDLEVTCREPAIGVVGNWMLSLLELYVRDPRAERYAIFQDDLVCVAGLKRYLSLCAWPEHAYFNLLSFPENESRAPANHVGWHPSDQRGKGAVALVFDQEAVIELMTVRHYVEKPRGQRARECIDGSVAESFRVTRRIEHVHMPSLVQHVGEASTLGHAGYPPSQSFPGESFDACTLLQKQASVPSPAISFEGRWWIGQPPTTTFTLTARGRASKQPGVGGTWEAVNGAHGPEARISWSDGWKDALRPTGGGRVTKYAFAPGTGFEDAPVNAEAARRA